jgi:hypothetical protein
MLHLSGPVPSPIKGILLYNGPIYVGSVKGISHLEDNYPVLEDMKTTALTIPTMKTRKIMSN